MPKYEIIDEPLPGRLAGIIVNPFYVLLGQMLGGSWLAWPWFLLNSHALGSATRKRETKLLALAVAGSVVLAFMVAATARHNAHVLALFSYALLGLRAFKLVMAYLLFVEQRKSFQIYEAFGGAVRNAAAVVAVGYMLRQVIFSMTDNLVVLLILA
jgi:hypothetical protein